MGSCSIGVILLACAALQIGPAQPSTRLLDVTAMKDGAVVSVAARGDRTLEIRVNEAGMEPRSHVVNLERLPETARIEGARVARYMERSVVIGVIVQYGAKYSYHFLHNAPHTVDGEADANGWLFSDPIFEDNGPPFRIIEVANPGGDTLEITFRRGQVVDPRSALASLEMKVYHDTCPVFRNTTQGGRTALLELTGARRAERDR